MLLPHFLGHLNSESGLCGKQQSLALGSTCSESYGGTHFDHLTHALRVRPIVSSIWKRQKPTRNPSEYRGGFVWAGLGAASWSQRRAWPSTSVAWFSLCIEASISALTSFNSSRLFGGSLAWILRRIFTNRRFARPPSQQIRAVGLAVHPAAPHRHPPLAPPAPSPRPSSGRPPWPTPCPGPLPS